MQFGILGLRHGPGLNVEPDPGLADIGETEDVLAEPNHPAVLVRHLRVGVKLLDRPSARRILRFGNLEAIAADTITRRHENEVAGNHRRGGNRRLPRTRSAPEHLARGRFDADDAGIGKLNHLAGLADGGENSGRIRRFVRNLFRAPDHPTGFLIQGGDRSPGAAGRHDHLVPNRKRRFGEAPARHHLAAEILFEVRAPEFPAGTGIHASEIAKLPHGKDETAVHGRCAARAGKSVSAANRADFMRPNWLAVGFVQHVDEAGIRPIAHGVDAALRHGDAAKAGADTRRFPRDGGTSRRPFFEQPGFL